MEQMFGYIIFRMAHRFSSPPDPYAFNALVWEIVRRIPPGKVCTYGNVAKLLPPLPGVNLRDLEIFGARWVGGAMAASPEGVPWQRVVNAQGKISLADPVARQRQRELLQAEGVEFDARDRIDLVHFGWDGTPGADSVVQQRLFD
jgi:methylated-DNA-protein-cysteine methyltransferase-like protein